MAWRIHTCFSRDKRLSSKAVSPLYYEPYLKTGQKVGEIDE